MLDETRNAMSEALLRNNEYIVGADELMEFTVAVFRAAGMSEEYAALQSEVLVWANLRGIDSHGVLRIPWYVGRIDAGDLIPSAVPKIITQRFGTAVIESAGAPGPVATMSGVEVAIEKARASGISWVVVRDLSHNGALGYYTQKIANAGMIGITTVCSPPNMAPHGAKAPGLHNSPISIGVPARKRDPVILDMATSVAAGGKIYYAADRGIPIPTGWALDELGEPTTDPNKAKIWLPFGGPKGSGLAMMFECWSSLLASNPLCTPRITGEMKAGEQFRQNGIVSAIDVSAFMDPEEYMKSVDEFMEALKALPTSSNEPVLVPGEREEITAAQREKVGIALPIGTMDRINVVAHRFGILAPWSR
jgi:ureidoglycolate dehydrogenase (NAD+)